MIQHLNSNYYELIRMPYMTLKPLVYYALCVILFLGNIILSLCALKYISEAVGECTEDFANCMMTSSNLFGWFFSYPFIALEMVLLSIVQPLIIFILPGYLYFILL